MGTAVQDLALAQSALDAAVAEGRGRDLGELTRLKAFATLSSGNFPPSPRGPCERNRTAHAMLGTMLK